jgi:Fe-S cluster assembly protein SufD
VTARSPSPPALSPAPPAARSGVATFAGPVERSSPLAATRIAAFERFVAMGLPTTRDDEWRYTSLRAIAGQTYRPAPDDRGALSRKTIAPLRLDGCLHAVFVNGRFAPDLSDDAALAMAANGTLLRPLERVAASDWRWLAERLGTAVEWRDEAFAALNMAMGQDGAVIALPPGARPERPFHLVFVTTGATAPFSAHPRVLVDAGPGAEATIIETHVRLGDGESTAATLTNAVTEILAADASVIDHYHVVQPGTTKEEAAGAAFVSTVAAHLAAGSRVTSHSFATGGGLVRKNVRAKLLGEGADGVFNGLSLGHGRDHVDNHLRIDHVAPRCTSWEYYKSVLDDRASSVFTGRIFVAQDAQKTDAKQTSMNLLLSDDAQATTRPQLEIFADDVKCTHGATTGQIDETQLFYLRARGIPPAAARRLLVYAFANETISEVRVEALRASLERQLLGRLHRGGPGS